MSDPFDTNFNLLERIAEPRGKPLSSGCLLLLGCFLFFAAAIVLLIAYLGIYGFALWGTPPTLWEQMRPWLFVFGPPSAVIVWLLLSGVRKAKSDGHRRNGRCAACGYDLRATPDRCPECGAVPTSSNAPSTDAAQHPQKRVG